MHRIDPTDWDDLQDPQQTIHRGRRKLHARRSTTDLHVEEGLETSSMHKFADPDLQNLFERGAIDEVLLEIKSGKEATVYLVESRQGLLAAKVYADMKARSFQNDDVYQRGRFIKDERVRRAVAQRSGFGTEVRKALWVTEEYRQLWQLHGAGLPVPKPALGPEPTQYGEAGSVVLMEYLGDEEGPAPRLSDLRLSPAEAEDAFAQSVEILRRFTELGKVHGDYSTYNLLLWEGVVYAIDFPQVVEAEMNPLARELLERDAASLCRSFRRLGVDADPGAVLRDVLQGAGGRR